MLTIKDWNLQAAPLENLKSVSLPRKKQTHKQTPKQDTISHISF